MKDKAMKKPVFILAAMMALCGCSYDELPPKTDDITTNYVLPKGEIPTNEEKAVAEAAKAEYENALNNI